MAGRGASEKIFNSKGAKGPLWMQTVSFERKPIRLLGRLENPRYVNGADSLEGRATEASAGSAPKRCKRANDRKTHDRNTNLRADARRSYNRGSPNSTPDTTSGTPDPTLGDPTQIPTAGH